MSPARFLQGDMTPLGQAGLMSDYRFTVTMKDCSAYVIGECPSCATISAYEVTVIGAAESLPCPCGHSVEVTASLFERMLEKLREVRRTAPATQTKH